MLKKLVKYGNSNALILDKALLEVLNIAEGSTLKIRTDGTSLIITPLEHASHNKITSSITPHETFKQAMSNTLDSFTKTKASGEGQEYFNEINNVLARYEQPLKNVLNNPQNPELIAMENEIKEISQKYAPVEYQYRDVDNKGALTLAFDAFKKAHEKYAYLHPQIIQLNENQEYIHESVLLAEKYQSTKNSPEYFKEYTELIAKYIPEYGTYQEEIKKISETCK